MTRRGEGAKRRLKSNAWHACDRTRCGEIPAGKINEKWSEPQELSKSDIPSFDIKSTWENLIVIFIHIIHLFFQTKLTTAQLRFGKKFSYSRQLCVFSSLDPCGPPGEGGGMLPYFSSTALSLGQGSKIIHLLCLEQGHGFVESAEPPYPNSCWVPTPPPPPPPPLSPGCGPFRTYPSKSQMPVPLPSVASCDDTMYSLHDISRNDTYFSGEFADRDYRGSTSRGPFSGCMSASISGSCRVFGRITHVANTLRATLATRAFITVRSMASAGSGDGGKRKENRLAKERSPYLLQHKDNPVDWWVWWLP